MDGAGTDEQPDFLHKFPWYSGTSADLLKTMFDLTISLKLFLGRFDMRTMQARTPPSACHPQLACFFVASLYDSLLGVPMLHVLIILLT